VGWELKSCSNENIGAEPVTVSDGVGLCLFEGSADGAWLGLDETEDGDEDEFRDGFHDGMLVGFDEEVAVGCADGMSLGINDGTGYGNADGTDDFFIVGDSDGAELGNIVVSLEGRDELSWIVGVNDGDCDGKADGFDDFVTVGKSDGLELGIVEESFEGCAELDPSVGFDVGSEEDTEEIGTDLELGVIEGICDGKIEGWSDVCIDGALLGRFEGLLDGDFDGLDVGDLDGLDDISDGTNVGVTERLCDGWVDERALGVALGNCVGAGIQ